MILALVLAGQPTRKLPVATVSYGSIRQSHKNKNDRSVRPCFWKAGKTNSQSNAAA